MVYWRLRRVSVHGKAGDVKKTLILAVSDEVSKVWEPSRRTTVSHQGKLVSVSACTTTSEVVSAILENLSSLRLQGQIPKSC